MLGSVGANVFGLLLTVFTSRNSTEERKQIQIKSPNVAEGANAPDPSIFAHTRMARTVNTNLRVFVI